MKNESSNHASATGTPAPRARGAELGVSLGRSITAFAQSMISAAQGVTMPATAGVQGALTGQGATAHTATASTAR